jgi:hypothetical protein
MLTLLIILLTLIFVLGSVSPLLITDEMKDIVEIGSKPCS